MIVKDPKKVPKSARSIEGGRRGQKLLGQCPNRHKFQKGASLTCRRKETIMLVALSTRLITCASSYLRESVWVVCTWIEASELAE